MDKIVVLTTDRPRPRRSIEVPLSGARILFFTGVRYCREDEPARFVSDHRTAQDALPVARLELALDLAAH